MKIDTLLLVDLMPFFTSQNGFGYQGSSFHHVIPQVCSLPNTRVSALTHSYLVHASRYIFFSLSRQHILTCDLQGQDHLWHPHTLRIPFDAQY